MFQKLNGKTVFVVELKTFPPLMPIISPGDPMLEPYAQALTAAIDRRIVKETGKYAIEVNFTPFSGYTWNIYTIQE